MLMRTRPRCLSGLSAAAAPGVGRQDKAHPHGISVTPDGQYVFVADLGRNSVFMYALRQDGQIAELVEQVLHEGAGPRHLAFAQVRTTTFLGEFWADFTPKD
jgi:6-phosphogluconolactonase (cycloisomerase 2 family)